MLWKFERYGYYEYGAVIKNRPRFAPRWREGSERRCFGARGGGGGRSSRCRMYE